jgi:hypothetical protein
MTGASYPRISIITATFNAAAQLPYTIHSMREQTSRDFEWIVVDGDSTDGTRALLHENEDLISRWISEPDQGIYDAFNKGCALARGEWLLFLGAGDELSSRDTLSECKNMLEAVPQATVLAYGRLTLIGPDTRTAYETLGLPWEEMRNKWEIGRPVHPPHAATFHRKTLFSDRQFFDLRFPIAGDSHLLIRSISQMAPQFLSLEVARAAIGGVSQRLDKASQIIKEIAAINRDLGLKPPLTVKIHMAMALAVISIINIFPQRIAHVLGDWVRRLMGKPKRWTVR